jgi:hypothetical protein
MCIQNIVHALNIVPGLNRDHHGMFIEQVNPFLSISIVRQKILANKSIPG